MAAPLAIVTGASSGIGLELARCCGRAGFTLLIAADTQIEAAAARLRGEGFVVEAVAADLSTTAGVDRVLTALAGRPVDALLANAGLALGEPFLRQDFSAARRVVDTNVTGTLSLVHSVGGGMRRLGRGRILITGSIVGFIPGAYMAVYNATKSFLHSFATALGHELRGSGVTVTCLLPGATKTEAFARAGLLDALIAKLPQASPAKVATIGFQAMMQGRACVVPGLFNTLQAVGAQLMPAGIKAALNAVVAKKRPTLPAP